MSSLVSLDSVSHQIGNKQLFHNIKLAVEEGARIGIVGPNGSGKSTLLKIMAGQITPDSGRVVTRRDIKVALVPQMDNFASEDTVISTVVNELAKDTEIHTAEVKAAKTLTQLGFTDLQKNVGELSGGWRKRLALAVALAAEPQLLLLDEPTNHLDLAGLLWLEELLLKEHVAWVLISHDRYFLERTVNEIIEIAPVYETGIFEAEGSYLDFLEKREVFFEQEASRTASLANKVRNELEWASRGARGRTTKAESRLKQANRLHEELKEIRQRNRKVELDVAFAASGRETKELVEFINVSFGFGDRDIICKESFKVTQGMCLGILGINGQGKSTLLKLIGGDLLPAAGKIKQAAFLKVVYFDQLRHSLNAARTVREAISDGQSQVVYQGKAVALVTWARRFGFDIDTLDRPLNSLSGGEQGRLLLSKLVRQEADMLLLDEPTNDLDIPMLEALESMLVDFNGATVLVTHDRFMLEKVCTHYLGFTSGQRLLPYASYEQWQEGLIAEAGQKAVRSAATKEASGLKFSETERRELGQIENKILKAEKLLEDLQMQAADPAAHADYDKSHKISEELSAARQKVDDLYHRWAELDSKRSGG